LPILSFSPSFPGCTGVQSSSSSCVPNRLLHLIPHDGNEKFLIKLSPVATPDAAISNILSIDVEEYFDPTEVQSLVDQSSWERLPSRVESQAIHSDLLEEKCIKATYVMLHCATPPGFATCHSRARP
jgi:hypothetical protein